jgi:ABC-type Fe3+ transport system permease subunit
VIINRQHLGWAAFVFTASALAVLLYVGEFHSEAVRAFFRLPAAWHRDVRETGRSVGATPLGLIFGSVSAAIFLFAALLGLRRKRPTLKVGRLQTWLKGHIWLTLLTVPLIMLHCGFSLGSPMTTMLVLVYAYAVRFLAPGIAAVEAGVQQVPEEMTASARTLGERPRGVMWRVHLPLSKASLVTAAVLVGVDALKELPIVLLLRPFGFDTLPVWVYNLAIESRFQQAALPALSIIVVALVPVILLSRRLDRADR